MTDLLAMDSDGEMSHSDCGHKSRIRYPEGNGNLISRTFEPGYHYPRRHHFNYFLLEPMKGLAKSSMS